MKLGQLITYKMKNIIFEKLYTKCGGEIVPDPFIKNQNWAYLWINRLQFYKICFYCMSKSGLPKYIKSKVLTTSFYLTWSFFLKKKRGLEQKEVPLPYLLHNFERKIFLALYFINWPSVIVWLPLLLKISGDMCIAIICYPVCDVINFEINHSFRIRPFLHNQKVSTKM